MRPFRRAGKVKADGHRRPQAAIQDEHGEEVEVGVDDGGGEGEGEGGGEGEGEEKL